MTALCDVAQGVKLLVEKAITLESTNVTITVRTPAPPALPHSPHAAPLPLQSLHLRAPLPSSTPLE